MIDIFQKKYVKCCLVSIWKWNILVMILFKSINQRKGKWNFIYLLKFLIKFLTAETSQNVPKFHLAQRQVTQTLFQTFGQDIGLDTSGK